MTLGYEAALVEFCLAASDGRSERAQRMLRRFPQIAASGWPAALLLGDAPAVETALAGNPGLAVAAGGPRAWQPLHYVCHTSVGREPGLAATAQLLLRHGADANLRFPWLHHGVRRPVLWGALRVVRSRAMARVLLEARANPNDGVCVTLAAGAGDIPSLDLLREFGADANFPWATDGAAPLYAILHWCQQLDGAFWLLDHGAEPDPVFAATGETPLHVAAARGDTTLAAALVERGADPRRHRADGRTPYALAELNGNRETAAWLRAQGAAESLSGIERLLSACSRGDAAAVAAMLQANPELRQRVAPGDYALFYRAAERDDAAAVEAMLAAGFDPNRGDEEMGMTALHRAAMAGRPAAVRVLLAHGASPAARDREFHSTPLFAAAEGMRARGDVPPSDGCDFDQVARLLLAAGSPLDWQQGEEPAGEHWEIVKRWIGARRAG